jgi:hypothetical protein
MFRVEHNVETDEIIEIQLTAEEIVKREKEHLEAQEKLNKLIAEENATFAAKAALLEKLGITEDEAKLLLS